MTSSPLDALPTELPNPRTSRIDTLPTLEVLQLINDEDQRVAPAVRTALPAVARAVDLAFERWQRGGRILLFGAGTSGRLAMLDAAELLPTFGVPPERYLARLAGGDQAFLRAAEGAEDDHDGGRAAAADLRRDDVAFGIAASGRTPWVIGVLEAARDIGSARIGLTCVPRSELASFVDVTIEVDTGAEAIAGSTRMKAATAQKLVLNAFSTALMVRLGKVYGNLMIDVQPTNAKLRRRAIRLVHETTHVDETTAENALVASSWNVKAAIAAVRLGLSAEEAVARLADAQGQLRQVLGEVP